MRNSFLVRVVVGMAVASTSLSALAATPLELRQSVQIAVQQSPTAILAQQKLQLARARFQQAQAALLPSLDVAPIWSYGQRLQNNLSYSSWEPTDETTLSLKIRQSLSPLITRLGVEPGMSGQAGASSALSRLDLRSAEAEFQKSLEDLAIDVISRYIGVLKAENDLSANQKSVEKAKTYLSQAQTKFEHGLLLKADLLKMQTQLATARYNLLRAENALKQAQSGFNSLLGYPADQPLELGHDLPSSLFAGAQGSLDLQKAMASALDKRAEIIQGRISLQQAKIEASQAKAQTQPEFTLTGRYDDPDDGLNGSISLGTKTWTLNTDVSKGAGLSGTSGKTTLQSSKDWSVALELNWNLFDGGSARDSVREAALAVSQSETNLRQAKDNVAQDVRQSYDALIEAQNHLPVLEMARAQAEENLKVVSAQYRVGEKTIADLFDAELALLTAENDYHNAQMDELVAEAIFQRATGNLDIAKNFGVELPKNMEGGS